MPAICCTITMDRARGSQHRERPLPPRHAGHPTYPPSVADHRFATGPRAAGHDESMCPRAVLAAPGNAVVLTRRWLPLLAGTVGGLLVCFVIAAYALDAVYAALAANQLQALADIWVTTAFVLWWAFIVLSYILAALVVVCWRSEPRKGRRALRLIGIGLALTWFWRLVFRVLEGWLLGLIAGGDETSPNLVVLGTISAIVNEVIDLAAALLLIAGAVRLRRVHQDQGVRGRS